VSTSGGHRVVHFGGEEIGASELIVAVGRKPRVDGLSLESVGLSPEVYLKALERLEL
jgi:pyruvate/2-oxoglutarate dehydrogenase complex dihydrolipoamide dehydrogenase (E3) component